MLMSNEAQNHSKLIRINKSEGPETLPEALIIENRLHTRYQLEPEEGPALEMSLDNWRKIENSLYGTGCAHYNTEEQKLRFIKYIGSDLAQKILSKISDEEVKTRLILYIREVNDFIRKKDEDLKKTVQDQVAEDKKAQSTITEDIEKIRKHYDLKRTESRLLMAQKAKPVRVFSDAEKSRFLDWQLWAEEDLSRSKQNLLDKKIELKKEIKQIEKNIKDLDIKIIPHSQKIEGLKKLIETDLPEDKFKDTKLSIEYNQAQVEKLQNRMIPFFEKNDKLRKEVGKIDQQLKILDICIDREALLKDAKINFPRRRERLLLRVNKHIRETEEIQNLQNALNRRWQEVSGDTQELMLVLGLKTESQLFFI